MTAVTARKKTSYPGALTLDSPVRYLKGVGQVRSQLLARLGIATVSDLIYFFPRRYEDRRQVLALKDLIPGGPPAAVRARVVSLERRRTSKRQLEIQRACITDGVTLAYALWFNRRGLESLLKPGVELALYGRAEARGSLVELVNPELEVLNGQESHSLGRVVPIYSVTAGIPEKWLRLLIDQVLDQVLDQVDEILPEALRQQLQLPLVSWALEQMHRPSDDGHWKLARRRLAFEELFALQTGLALRRLRGDRQSALPLDGVPALQRRFLQSLTFALTEDQRRVCREIDRDLASSSPMNRLLQGDVGSGKTVVALMAMLRALDSGAQAALMAPTAVLAQQHAFTLKRWLEPLGIDVGLLLGGTKAADRQELLAALAAGSLKILVGTHALLQEGVEFQDLGLVVVDEQHRFGVLQRKALAGKGGARSPHRLVMTATPIPRTLALSIYGDLAISTIRQMPQGRRPVRTYWIRENRLPGLMDFLESEMVQGRQVYWVCPVIEESETLEVTSLEQRFEALKGAYPHRRIASLHGRMAQAEKETVMADFSAGRIDLLAATTVIEVGVDVPNASVMVVEGAERFGLSQLHQLRGRVGRGAHQSWCVLVASPKARESLQRLEALCQSSDGFQIAETDMRLRGPGEFCGVRQHGLTDFRVANLIQDGDLMEQAQAWAKRILEDQPFRNHPALMKCVLERYGELLDIAHTG